MRAEPEIVRAFGGDYVQVGTLPDLIELRVAPLA
jgi:hypothetical protein